MNEASIDTMRAVAFMRFGGPEVLRVIELPVPRAGDGEVVVRVVASSVNPTDLLMRSGRQAAMMTALTPPYIDGMEFSGHVYAAGRGVSGLRVGQAVMGVVNPRRSAGGAHAQYVCVRAASLAPLDAGIDLAAAATLPMNGLTAKMAIEALELLPGRSLLVTGAAGLVGGYVMQLARHAGLVVIADAKPDDVELVRRLGADEVVPRGDAMAAAVRQGHPKGVDGLVDCALIGARAGALVRDGGSVVTVRKSSPIDDPRLRVRAIAVTDRMDDSAALMWLVDRMRDGVLTPRVGPRLPMSDAALAHRLLEQGGVRGRIVLMFDDW